jgi:DNA-binding HxlR family transcriptional regulator
LANIDPESGAFLTDCPGREIFDHVTSRWGLLLLLALVDGPLRFHVLRDSVEGISEKMLSQSLKILSRDGLVERLVESTIPPRVSYKLSAIGHEVAAPLNEVLRWIGRRILDIHAAQKTYDAGKIAPLPARNKQTFAPTNPEVRSSNSS